ncbi:c-type cytochrome [Cupriavidus basilensis]|uniref:c-type cytochrome n=1 Tax=Cupriavidus basilensis TaxID=68895 RepID=UPI0023E8573A|nr:c-type cytochrome [Cupriavidus basilensis]MDF3885363.1 c-type cytochrome [Cupriavidus basilensis]
MSGRDQLVIGQDSVTAWQPPPERQWLAGHVIRPPVLEWHAGSLRSARLLGCDEAAARALPGVASVVRRGNFLGIAAATAQQAAQAAGALRARWQAPPKAVDPGAPLTRRLLAAHGDTTQAMAHATGRSAQGYQWPLSGLQPAGCTAVADWRDGALRVWLPSRNPGALRTELAALLGVGEDRITLVCWQAMDGDNDRAGEDAQYAHHAAADAALLAQAAGGTVRVRVEAHELGATQAQVNTHIESAWTVDGEIAAYAVNAAVDARGSAAVMAAPPLALWLTGTPAPVVEIDLDASGASDESRGDAILPPYRFASLSVTQAGAPGLPRAAGTPAQTARAYVFAHESHVDEVAAASAQDPVALRLRHLDDARGAGLVRRVAAQANWQPRGERTQANQNVRRGRGFAYASTIEAGEANAGQPVQSWSAWVAEVEVDASTGEVSVTGVTLGHDSDAGEQGAGNAPALQQEAARAAQQLIAGGSFDSWPGTAAPALPARHDAGLPALAAAPLPQVRIAGALGAATTTLGTSAAATLPAAPAVANAIFDATGVRLREPPFSGERIRLALAAQGRADGTNQRGAARKRNWLLAGATAAVGLFATAMPWRAPIAPVVPPEAGFYSAATIERGRLVAAAGDCAVCHTAPNGVRNAGGLALDTPFGTIYSTNITPDVETGIGNWSYAAFERAMRQGIHRDGRHLYPAFPYTAFAKVSDGDLQALYAYLMAAEPVRAKAPETALAFPYNLRPLMAGWNLLFHRAKPFEANPARSAQWNRGAYLAEGLGHCSACHSPRNALGAERGGRLYLGGGEAEGWEAPALGKLSHAPVPWTEQSLFEYLRTGYAPHHGAAAGPMAPVVEELALLPEDDVRAIAHYVASFGETGPDAAAASAQAMLLEQRSADAARALGGPAARLYQNACAVCHQGDQGIRQFGIKPSLALNTNLHGDKPDNLISVLLDGIPTPAASELGYMPAFGESLDDRQLTQLVHYLRARFAPDKPAWENVDDTLARLRAAPSH